MQPQANRAYHVGARALRVCWNWIVAVAAMPPGVLVRLGIGKRDRIKTERQPDPLWLRYVNVVIVVVCVCWACAIYIWRVCYPMLTEHANAMGSRSMGIGLLVGFLVLLFFCMYMFLTQWHGALALLYSRGQGMSRTSYGSHSQGRTRLMMFPRCHLSLLNRYLLSLLITKSLYLTKNAAVCEIWPCSRPQTSASSAGSHLSRAWLLRQVSIRRMSIQTPMRVLPMGVRRRTTSPFP